MTIFSFYRLITCVMRKSESKSFFLSHNDCRYFGQKYKRNVPRVVLYQTYEFCSGAELDQPRKETMKK